MGEFPRFPNRIAAGRALALRLASYSARADALVLGLPRGGVPVAFEVAAALGLALDVFIVRKLGVPGHEELAMGALASGGTRILNDELVRDLGISQETIDRVAAGEMRELARRERLYRGDREPPDLSNRIIILIDDGLATGSTMRAAVAAIRQQGPRRIVAAVPVAAAETCRDLRAEVDEVICAVTPDPFLAVGLWYDDFSPTTDEEVRALLARSRNCTGPFRKSR